MALANINDFEFIRYIFTDINGVPRTKLLPRNSLTSENLKEGEGIFVGANMAMGPMEGLSFKTTNFSTSNVFLRPCFETLHAVPWARTMSGEVNAKVGAYLCETFFEDDSPQLCSRKLARNQLEELAKEGMSIKVGVEQEFYLTQKNGDVLPGGFDYHSGLEAARHEPVLRDIAKQLNTVGAGIGAMVMEYSPGQIELICKPRSGITAVDNVVIIKQAIKEIAQFRHDYGVTFMTKPFVDYMASSSHFNHSLWDLSGKHSVLYDVNDKDKLSEKARYWIGGLIKHAAALTALCNPTVNCYRRLHKPFCPDKNNWGIDDRAFTFRVKNTSPNMTLVENRLPSSAANMYVVLAATVAAGLDGIRNKINPPAAGAADAAPLVNTFEEALNDLEKNKVLQEALGKDFIGWFLIHKRELELEPMKSLDSDDVKKHQKERYWFFNHI